MRILMLAPEPFFEPRGTPFSVFHRARALGRLGHEIDLVTYPVGKDVDLPNVTLHRTWRLPFIKQVKIGPSLAKLPLDFLLFFKALSMLLRHQYDVIHTHEEAGVFGAILSWMFAIPHIYDMHSDLAQQMTNFQFTQSPILINGMHQLERFIVHSASAVIVICPELLDSVEILAPGKPTVLIENTAVAAEGAEQSAQIEKMDAAVAELRQELQLRADAGPVLLYTGTFESYQGLDLLVQSIPAVLAQFPQAVYVFAGGHPDQVATIAALAQELGVQNSLKLAGQRQPEEMPVFMHLADVLLSPRSQGTNTPLKIYSYLHSGKPILATNILSHTQVLNDNVAVLVDPTSEALAQGALALLGDAELGQRVAQHALELARDQYSYATYLQRTVRVYQTVFPEFAPLPA